MIFSSTLFFLGNEQLDILWTGLPWAAKRKKLWAAFKSLYRASKELPVQKNNKSLIIHLRCQKSIKLGFCLSSYWKFMFFSCRLWIVTYCIEAIVGIVVAKRHLESVNNLFRIWTNKILSKKTSNEVFRRFK